MIKTCVCVSGIPRSGLGNRDLRRNLDVLKQVFPDADFYFGTWKGNESVIEKYFYDQSVKYFDEPEITYHPFIDIDRVELGVTNNEKLTKVIENAKKDRVFFETSKNQTKQILAHCYLLDTIEEKYDVVIRCRYDTIVYSKANFFDFIKQSYDKNIAIGFATLRIDQSFSKYELMPTGGTYHNSFLFDQLIIHTYSILDRNFVYSLHEAKKLISAEHGWWQVLSKNNNHVCVNGWANPDKSVIRDYL